MEKAVQELIGVNSPIQTTFLKEGQAEIEGKEYHHNYEKIINKTLFDKVRSIMDKRNNKQKPYKLPINHGR